MVGQSNFTGVFAKALLAATPEKLLVEPRKAKYGAEQAVTTEQIASIRRQSLRQATTRPGSNLQPQCYCCNRRQRARWPNG